ncbi:hypothetical protein B0G69_2578 [Paraburkholderia sp. RAU2J]|nr:hypothetical protein B0G69_2578 [Paraburkholderia sp. RAU2J]
MLQATQHNQPAQEECNKQAFPQQERRLKPFIRLPKAQEKQKGRDKQDRVMGVQNDEYQKTIYLGVLNAQVSIR